MHENFGVRHGGREVEPKPERVGHGSQEHTERTHKEEPSEAVPKPDFLTRRHEAHEGGRDPRQENDLRISSLRTKSSPWSEPS